MDFSFSLSKAYITLCQQLETVGVLSLVSPLSMTGVPPACGVHGDAGAYGEYHW